MAGRLLWVVVLMSSGHAFVSERIESTFLDDITEVPSELFLQVEAEVSVTVVKADLAPQRFTRRWPVWADLVQRSSRLKATVSAGQLLSFSEHIAKYLVSISYVAFLAICAYLRLRGLPSKTPQHSSVKGEGCSRRWCIYMGVVYMVIYASTDQYVPSLPVMEKDLEGSQVSMTATVQINWVVKALFGLFAAGLSDRIGRRPVALTCMFVLCMSTFCCACAGHVEWFVAARILQGMGESFEPVVYAMIRDYYSDLNARIRVSAFLQIMALIGSSFAPFYGSLCAEFLGWRASFFGLCLIWLVLASVACVGMVESCPDERAESYFKDISRLWDLHLACLLATESLVMSAYFTFNANCSYLIEGIFHGSVMTAATILLIFGVLCSGGAVLSDHLQLSVLNLARIVLSLFAVTGLISIALNLLFERSLWAYLVGTFLQSSVMCMSLVSAQVLFCEPLADCAGMAASIEVLAQNLLPALVSAMATQSMIQLGPRGLVLWQANSCIAAGLVFWLGYGWCPPDWATTSTLETTATCQDEVT